MTIGAGIFLAGLWVFVGLVAMSPSMTNKAFILASLSAIAFSIALI